MTDRSPAQVIADVFDRSAATYDTVIPFFAELGARLVDLAALRPGDHVLDVGCGKGAALIPAAAACGEGGQVVGIDLAPRMIEWLQGELARQGAAHASVRVMDAHALDFPDHSFDAVLANMVLHLLPDPVAAATEMRRVLRPSGRCAAMVPAGAGPEWDFIVQIFREHASRATRPLTMPFRPEFDLGQVLATAGFDVTAVHEVSATFHFPTPEAWWRWAWSHGMRGYLEALPPDALGEVRERCMAEVEALMTPAGAPMRQKAAAALGRT